ncbi:MAG: glycine cleavage system aminomethyltransferase GcvT [Microbacteriaceae bacterium]
MTSSESPQPEHSLERLSPLNDAHVAAGANFTDFAGWQMPVRYTSDLAEHHAVRAAAGLFDLSHMAEILVLGPEAAAALDYALAGKISAVAIGQAKYSLLLHPSGGIIDDVVVYRTGDDRFMVVANAANRDVVVAQLRARTAGFDVETYDESDDVALIAVQGPAALAIITAVEGFAVEGGHPNGSEFAQTLSNLRYYWSFAGLFREQPALFARTGYTGEDGFELYIAPDQATDLWNALLEAGAPHGLVPAGLASRDTLRLEAGMPLYGHELGLDTFPAQAGLGRVVNLGKDADFVGRAASEEGPTADAPVLVGLVGEGKRAARAGYEVFCPASDGESGTAIGTVTSGALSPTLGHPIAIAYVGAAFAQPGTELAVDIRGSKLPFTVTTLPFYSRKKN